MVFESKNFASHNKPLIGLGPLGGQYKKIEKKTQA